MKHLIKFFFCYLFLFQIITAGFAQLKFEPIALNHKNQYLFHSSEIISGSLYNKTLFYGFEQDSNQSFQAVTFYPENLYYSENKKRLFIHNKMGLYYYDLNKNEVKTINIFPNFKNKDEYIIYRLSEINFSPDFRYVIGKVSSSNAVASIFLYDLAEEKSYEIIKDVEVKPGKPAGSWSNDSNFFIYQKNGSLYYFSINDFKRNKLLNEKWRYIGKGEISNLCWTRENYLIWIEDNLIYRSDPNQFFSRSIYRKYIRQGNVIKKIPFSFNPLFDSFYYNDVSRSFVVVKNSNSIFYYTLDKDQIEKPYLQLKSTMQFEDCRLFDTGEAVLTIKEIVNGEIHKKIILLKKINDHYRFSFFNHHEVNNINYITISENQKYFVINSAKGAHCYSFYSEEQEWKYDSQEVVYSLNIENQWLIAGKYTTILGPPQTGQFTPLFASSFHEAGFLKSKIGIKANEKQYIIDKELRNITEYKEPDFDLYRQAKTDEYRLVIREINKGFYHDGVYLKTLYSGKMAPITGEPELKYQLYQPETKLGLKFYSSPLPVKHEIALVFDCTKTAEGIFNIITALEKFNIPATFFINGQFMEINPEIIKEMVYFDLEVGNMFQYNVNLTDSSFLIDKNFIRQGLSTNEERFFDLTGKNFSPLWHSPYYIYNEDIIKYGKESGYTYVTYNLDSLDWVGSNNSELNANMFMNNSKLITRIVKKIKPGQVIVFSTGINHTVRNDWLFHDLDLLLSELIRSGYSFAKVSDVLKKYRNE